MGVGKGAAPAPVTVTHLKLSPIREWHSDDGRAIHAELMSWPIEGAAAVHGKVEELDFDVVREGRIRLRREDRIFAVPLSRLSEEDRKFVAELVERIGRKDEARSGAGDAGEGGKGDREPAESAPAADESAAPPDNSAD